MKRLLCRLCLAVAWVISIFDPTMAGDIAAHSPDGAALLSALRSHAAPLISEPFVFHVWELRAEGDWAFVRVSPMRPGYEGDPHDGANSAFGRFAGESNLIDALFVKTGEWRMLECGFGPTDVLWVGWQERYGLPENLFNSEGGAGTYPPAASAPRGNPSCG